MKQTLRIELDGPFSKSMRNEIPILFQFDTTRLIGFAELFLIDGALFANACLEGENVVFDEFLEYSLSLITDNDTGEKNVTYLAMVQPGTSTIKISKICPITST